MLFRTAVRPEHRILAAASFATSYATVHTACRRAHARIRTTAEALVGVLQSEIRIASAVAVCPTSRRRIFDGALR